MVRLDVLRCSSKEFDCSAEWQRHPRAVRARAAVADRRGLELDGIRLRRRAGGNGYLVSFLRSFGSAGREKVTKSNRLP